MTTIDVLDAVAGSRDIILIFEEFRWEKETYMNIIAILSRI